MKKLILFVMFLSAVLYSQQATGEFNIFPLNLYGQDSITIKIFPVSTKWDSLHNLTSNYNGGFSYINSSDSLIQYDLLDNNSGTISMALGKYKITAVDSSDSAYFYIDWRTSDLPLDSGSFAINFDYDASEREFKIRNDSSSINNSTQKIWDLVAYIDSITINLQPHPPDSLAVSSVNRYPYLAWNHSSVSDDYWTHYEIYRGITIDFGTPPNYSLLDTVGKYITSYTDYEVKTGDRMTGYYKIKAVNGNKKSNFSNTASIGLSGFVKNNTESNKKYNFELKQNYPNPFNPATTINFTLSKDSYVKLKIYNLLGEEITTLIDRQMESGKYSYNFNAGNLHSGVYLYRIEAGEYVSTRKFILLK